MGGFTREELKKILKIKLIRYVNWLNLDNQVIKNSYFKFNCIELYSSLIRLYKLTFSIGSLLIAFLKVVYLGGIQAERKYKTS